MHELEAGGADRDRTDDLLNANQALSQLSYSPLDIQMDEQTNQKTSRPIGRGATGRQAQPLF